MKYNSVGLIPTDASLMLTAHNNDDSNAITASGSGTIIGTSTSTATASSISSINSINSSNSSVGNSSGISSSNSTGSIMTSKLAANAIFSEQVNTVTSLFEKWNDCERTVVIYKLLKRLPYANQKFLQYSIDNNIKQNQSSDQNLSTMIIDMNANNSSYLQNLLNAYKTLQTSQVGDLTDNLSSSSSDKDSMPYYGSEFQLTQCDERKLINRKEDILQEALSLLPLLRSGNDDAKMIYMTLIPLAVRDTMRQIVSTEIVQQIFSYLLIHPAFSNEDHRALNIWLQHLDEYVQNTPFDSGMHQHQHQLQYQSHSQSQQQQKLLQQPQNYLMTNQPRDSIGSLSLEHSRIMTTSVSSNCSVSTNSSCSVSGTSTANISQCCNSGRSADWQTIAPPSKQNQQMPQQHTQLTNSMHDWSTGLVSGSNSSGNGGTNSGGIISSNASSQNSLSLSLGATLMDPGHPSNMEASTMVNGLAAVAAVSSVPSLFGNSTNPIINIINNNNNDCNSNMNTTDDLDNSFSKNGTEILDFEPNVQANACETCNTNHNFSMDQNKFHHQLQMPFASMLISNCEQLDTHRWSLDSKLAALKTRRSNSLTTQTVSSSASSSNSSVITVNDNCSNSTENLAQFLNKPRSFSLSIEHQRGSLANSGSDTRLDDFRPNYIKFQTRNVGMSNIGLWLKSLRLHKYVDLFKNMTYEEMLHISEEYLQNLGVTKGASHKLVLCIEKLKERPRNLVKLEQDLLSGQLKVQQAVEDLANIVLTPMKPVNAVNVSVGEENVALLFLQVMDLVCSIVQKDPYSAQDDESLSVIMWILDRSIHNEAFTSHINKLKELKFKFSKMKMSIAPKMHHGKSGNNGGNMNKPSFPLFRWNGKGRKCEPKNGSNDRINHRKSSNDVLNFVQSNCLGHQQHHHSSSNHNKSQQTNDGSAYANFLNNQQQHQVKQQQQQQQQMLQQQSTHFSTPIQMQHHKQQQQQHTQASHQQHRRSLNNLILVSGGAQQAQKMIFKPGQGIVSATVMGSSMTTTSTDNLQMEHILKNQQRKASLPVLNNNSNNNNNCNTNNLLSSFMPIVNNNVTTNIDAAKQQQQQQQQQSQQGQQTQSQPQAQSSKKSIAAIVMVSSNDNLAAAVGGNNIMAKSQQSLPQILINSNNILSNSNILSQQQQQHLLQQHQQQQQQLQLLAVAAAAVGSSCNLNTSNCQNMPNCLCNNNVNTSSTIKNISSSINSNNNSNISTSSKCKSPNDDNCNNCNNLRQYDLHIANVNMPILKKNYSLANSMSDIRSLEQLETLCLQMTEQAIN